MSEITVIYADGMMDNITSDRLQELIDADAIIKFQRQDGWVYPGIDPVRKRNYTSYHGPERRNIH